MALFAGETNYFGLDVGTTAVRLVQLKKGGDKPYLVTYDSVAIPGEVGLSDSAKDMEQVAALIKQLVSQSGVSTKNVVAGLPTSKIFAAVINTPALSEAELNKAVKYQAEQYIPMAVDQVKLSHAVVGQSADGKQQEVLLVAAPNSVTDKYTQMMQKAGLDLIALEVNALAATRAVLAPNDTALVLDLGGMNSDITIVHQGGPKLMRSVATGGMAMVKSVAKGLGVDDTQAQQVMANMGLTPGKMEDQIPKALKTTLTMITGEIDKSVKFFNSHYPDVKLARMVLTGASSNMPGLAQYLADNTGLSVILGSPWQNVAYPAAEQQKLMSASDQYAVAVGLAMRTLA